MQPGLTRRVNTLKLPNILFVWEEAFDDLAVDEVHGWADNSMGACKYSTRSVTG